MAALPLLRSNLEPPVPDAAPMESGPRLLFPATTRIPVPVMPVDPSYDEPAPMAKVPAVTVTPPSFLSLPKERVPAPLFVSGATPVTSPSMARVPPATLMVGVLESTKDDVPMVRFLSPVNVKEPAIVPAPTPESTLSLAEELFSVPPEIARVPPPKAPTEFRFSVPPVIERPVA